MDEPYGILVQTSKLSAWLMRNPQEVSNPEGRQEFAAPVLGRDGSGRGAPMLDFEV